MSAQVKSVAVIGAGPVGLAAQPTCWSADSNPSCWKRGGGRPRRARSGRTSGCSRPGSMPSTRRPRACSSRRDGTRPIPHAYPTGGELVERYLEPLATRTALARSHPHLRPRHRHRRASASTGEDQGRTEAPFEVRYRNGAGDKTIRADAVIDASGTWSRPTRPAAAACPRSARRRCAARIAYGMPDVLGSARSRYAGKRVAVLGAGHSAVGTLIELATLARSAARNADHLADPRRRPGKILRRWCQRQAGRTRRARNPAGAAGRAGRDPGRDRLPVTHIERDRRAASHRRGLVVLRARGDRRRDDRRDRLPPRARLPERAAPRARSCARRPARCSRR